MYIYKTTNLVNNKVYIGKSEKSFNPNYLGSGLLLHRAIKKHGIKNFKLELIENCNTSQELNEREKYWIDFYYGPLCYNLAEGGTGGNTTKFYSSEQKSIFKKNLSIALTGRTIKETTKAKLSISNKGKFYGDKEVLSKSLKKVWQNKDSVFNSKEYRQKLSNSNLGRIFKKETCDKISKANSGRNNGMAIQIKVDDVLYYTRRECAKAYNISETAVTKRCLNSNFPSWELVNTKNIK